METKTCPTCGMPFQSRSPKRFCSLSCYTTSEEFLARVRAQSLKANAASQRARGFEPSLGVTAKCLECNKDIHVKPSQRKHRYCSRVCYRKYLAKRFDRFIANPERIALPQNYDEFLTGELLNCLVDGCFWKGHTLSQHMNLTHGVPAQQFKRMAGFNLSSGIVSVSLQQSLSERAIAQGGAEHMASFRGDAIVASKKAQQEEGRTIYRSREASEHWKKGRLLTTVTPVGRVCKGCGREFAQNMPFGRALFCGKDCRAVSYSKQASIKQFPLVCDVCGGPFEGTADQKRRAAKALPVMCSMECRQRRAGRLARGTWIKGECAAK